MAWVKNHHLIVGGYLLFGAYAWYKWNQASGSTPIWYAAAWPYALLTGSPAPWSIQGGGPAAPPPAS